MQNPDLSQPNSHWQEATLIFQTNPASALPNLPAVNQFQIWFHSTHQDQLEGFLDMDGVELDRIDNNGNTLAELLGVDVESLIREETSEFAFGEWPATIIDRVGGIAYWGSGNHHVTCGHAYADSNKLMRAFFAGRSLGESLMLNASLTTSGYVFGDSLYRASGAFIYVDTKTGSGMNREYPVKIKPSLTGLVSTPLKINGFHGTRNLNQTRIEVGYCLSYEDDCEITPLVTREGAVYGWELPLKFGDFLPSELMSLPVQTRLKVWNLGDEANALYSRAFFKLQEGEDSTDGVANPDMNNDGKVNSIDLSIFLSHWGTSNPDADFDGDGTVGSIDFAIFLAAWTG